MPPHPRGGADATAGQAVSTAASPRDAGLDAAGATVETTTLNVSV